jgi:cation diffusion facilitator family transporter
MDRFESTQKASIFGIIGNIFLLIIKTIVGIMTKSQAMIADSVNSAGDIFSSFMTFVGNKIASKPSDDDHNLGHGKAEYIFSLLVSISMIIVAVKLLQNSVVALINQTGYTFSWWLVVICIVTIITKLSLYIYTHSLAKKHNNILLEANAKDHINDCVATTFNLIAALLSLVGILWFDGIVGTGISVWILWSGINIFLESYNVLMDKTISCENKQKVFDIIKKYKEIKKVEHFNATPVGYKYQISFTIYVDGNLSTFESHEIANRLEKELSKLDEIYLTVIHVNPIKIEKGEH